MRRAILAAAVIGLIFAQSAAQADEPVACEPAGYADMTPPGNGVPLSRAYHNRYVYGGYGLKLRGGYGRNGFAPWHGPVWGPEAFLPAGGMGFDPRPNGAYVRPLMAEHMLHAPDMDVPAEDAVPAKEVKPIAYGAYRQMSTNRR